jgi:sporulation protein YlmC with PRC-barrel domain
MFTRILTVAALTAVLAGPAFAQQAGGATGFVQTQNVGGDWRGTKLIGASVYGPDNASIGEISDVLIGSDGKIHAVVVGVGGFLGIADKDIAIPFEALSIARGPASGAIDKVTVKYSKQQLQDAPRFALDPMSSPQTIGAGGARPPDHQ